MIHCTNCGQELSDTAKFCNKCGTAVQTAPSPYDAQSPEYYQGISETGGAFGQNPNIQETMVMNPVPQSYVDAMPQAHCTNCGAPLAAGATFCTSCGTPIQSQSVAQPQYYQGDAMAQGYAQQGYNGYAPAAVCPQCGAPLEPDATFCTTCGTPVQQQAYAMPNQAMPSAVYGQAMVAEEKPKKKTGLIIGIIVAVLVVGIAIGLVLKFFVFADSSSDANTANNTAITNTNNSNKNNTNSNKNSNTNTSSNTSNNTSNTNSNSNSAAPNNNTNSNTNTNTNTNTTTEIVATATVTLNSTTASGASVAGTVTRKGTDSSGAMCVIPNSSSTLLSTSDISNLSDAELSIARNEIYARHGYSFMNSGLKSYFTTYFKGYSGTVSDQSSISLNDTEKKNVETIRSLESSRNSPWLSLKTS